MNSITRITSLIIVAGGSVFAVPPEIYARIDQVEERNYRSEASRLLRQVQFSAAQLTRDAETLDTYSHNGVSRQSHNHQVNLVREHINKIGDRMERLEAIRHRSAPWQQQAIDSILPVARNLAVHTEAAIRHLNDTGKPLWDPGYRAHLRAILERSEEVKKTVNLHLEMADTEERLEQLRDRTVTLS